MQNKKNIVPAVNYKWIINIASAGLAFLCVVNTAFLGIKNFSEEKAREADYKRPALEKIMPLNTASNSQCMGKIYTLDGKRMTNRYYYKPVDDSLPVTQKTYNELDFDVESEKREGTDFATRFTEDVSLSVPTEVYYSTITGTESYGLLADAEGILKSQASKANRLRSEGSHIMTTIHSDAQRVAYEQIAEYAEFFESHDVVASLAVVSADGAVLVDVASNMQFMYDYIDGQRDYYKGIQYREVVDDKGNTFNKRIPYFESYDMSKLVWSWYYDYGLKVPDAVGSSFKPISARVLLENDDLLDENFSLYNNNYKDVNMSGYESEKIYNHNYSVPENELVRNLSLALQFSSNTYFLDHVKELSVDKYLQGLRDLFDLDAYENMGTYVRPPLLMSRQDPDYTDAYNINYGKLTYGQEAKLSAVSLASLYNTAVSGNYYHPFMVSKVYNPDYNVIYEYNTRRNVHKVMDIDIKNHILVKALSDSYISYVENTSYDYAGMQANTQRPLGRFLAKSGTADVWETGEFSTSTCNHTMVLTVLSDDCTQVICTAVIAVNNLPNSMDFKSNADYIQMLQNVVSELGVI